MNPTNEDFARNKAIEMAMETIKSSENSINEKALCDFMECVYQYLITGKLPD